MKFYQSSRELSAINSMRWRDADCCISFNFWKTHHTIDTYWLCDSVRARIWTPYVPIICIFSPWYKIQGQTKCNNVGIQYSAIYPTSSVVIGLKSMSLYTSAWCMSVGDIVNRNHQIKNGNTTHQQRSYSKYSPNELSEEKIDNMMWRHIIWARSECSNRKKKTCVSTEPPQPLPPKKRTNDGRVCLSYILKSRSAAYLLHSREVPSESWIRINNKKNDTAFLHRERFTTILYT